MSASRLPVIPPDELNGPLGRRPQNWRHPDVDEQAIESRTAAGGH